MRTIHPSPDGTGLAEQALPRADRGGELQEPPPGPAGSTGAHPPSGLPAVRLQRIVVGIDFALPSRRAATWVAEQLAGDAEVILLHVGASPQSSAFAAWPEGTRAELEETVRRGAEVRLHELGLALGARTVHAEVRLGNPAEQIVATAVQRGADLIVVGEHGEGGQPVGLLGGTLQRIARASHGPVLLCRNLPDGAPRRILAAVSGGDELPWVLAWARYLSARFGARVVTAHVVDPMMSRAVQLGAHEHPERARAELGEQAREWLASFDAGLGAPTATIEHVALHGEAGPEIAAAARRLRADLVILGRGGAGRPLSMLLGSAAEFVLRAGEGSVLLATAPLQPDAR